MKRISEFKINEKLYHHVDEKLTLNNQSKIQAKLFNELTEGDEIYMIINNSKAIGVSPKLSKIYTYIISEKPFFLKNENPKWLMMNLSLKIKGPNAPNTIPLLIDESNINKCIHIYENYYIFSTNELLLEKMIDEDFDKIIKPLQDEIYKLEQEINKLIKQKEDKYIK